MATVNNPGTLNGNFKEIYADGIDNLLPEVAKLRKLVDFAPRAKQTGDFYHQPIIVTGEQGVTYAGPSGDAFTLNNPIVMGMQDAQVQGYQIALRSQIGYGAAARAMDGGVRAFRSTFDLVVENMMESMAKRIEIVNFYGQSGIAKAASASATTATTTTVIMNTADWATGIWAGLENAEVNFYNAGSLVSSGADSIFTVTTINVNTKTVIFTGTSTGSTALVAAIAGAPGVVDVFFNGSFGNEAPGLKKIITNTGVLFNVNATTYNLWQGNSYSAASGELTLKKLQSAVSLAVQRGLDEKVTIFVNPNTWANLNSQLSATRMYDSSYSSSEGKNGVQAIKYYGQNGEMEIVAHSIVKEGDAFIAPLERVKRLGSTDITYYTPGMTDEKFFLQVPNTTAYELRLYTDQVLFVETPAKTVYISGIVNS